MTQTSNKAPHKLVFKLMALILLLSITTAGGFYWISSSDIGRYIHRTLFPNLQQHIAYVIRDIRQNPQPEYVSELARRLNMNIALSGMNEFWSTSEELDQYKLQRANDYLLQRKYLRLDKQKGKNRPAKDTDYDRHSDNEYYSYEPDDDQLELEHIPWLRLARRHPDLRLGKIFSLQIDNRPVIIYREPGQQITLMYKDAIRPFTSLSYLKILGWLLLITVIAFLLLYRMMRPLKDLRNGVMAIEQGNYNSVIPQRSKDELGRLVQSFNHMAKSVSEQIKRREHLLFDMSHELRSPLARIKIALEFLPDSHAKKLISDDISEQEIIIEELLENARLKNQSMVLNIKNINLAELIRDIVKKRNIDTLSYASKNKSIKIDIDSQRIQRVINNLIDNAIKYAPEGSAVIIKSTRIKGYVRVSVTDEGPGVAEADKERIFEPFYRPDDSRTRTTGGYGLGLNMCRQIIEAHKGNIYAKNTDKGFTVVFTIPNNDEKRT